MDFAFDQTYLIAKTTDQAAAFLQRWADVPVSIVLPRLNETPLWYWMDQDRYYGVTVSHCSPLEHALKAGYDRVMIFEDDAELVTEPAPLPSTWELLLFGGQPRATEPFLDQWHICVAALNTHAYAVQGSKAMRLMLHTWKHACKACDTYLPFFCQVLETYIHVPECIRQCQRKFT